ncbi:MAG TPA: hypothetical protein VE863_23035 [Pyrinomonadaceae bacterium]|nr:hypothetical protein [Pyrinomonadaceae bacterium]
MKPNLALTITSLLTIVFLTFHLSDEITRGMEPGRLNMVIPILVLAGWAYAALVLSGRRSGYIILLLGAIVGLGVPIVHMLGATGLVSSRIANSFGAFFWVWQNFTLALISACSLMLAVRGLWSLRRGQSRQHDNQI